VFLCEHSVNWSEHPSVTRQKSCNCCWCRKLAELKELTCYYKATGLQVVIYGGNAGLCQQQKIALFCSWFRVFVHRVRKNAPPPKQNAVTCTVYNTVQWQLTTYTQLYLTLI